MYPNHYMKADEVNDFMKQKIDELRNFIASDLQKYPQYDTDFCMLRWLLGWNYDIDTIVPKIRRYFLTMKSLKLIDRQFDDVDSVNKHSKTFAKAADHFPGGLMGYDRHGNIIYMHPITKTKPKDLVYAGSITELFSICITDCEGAFKLIRAEEAKRRQKLGIIVIVDMEHFNAELLHPSTFRIYLWLLQLIQELFPDLVRKIYIINCPALISNIYSLVKGALAEQTREKIVFTNIDWKQTLCNELGRENILEFWGGDKISTVSPFGTIRMGGHVPKHLRYTHEGSLFTVSDEQLCRVTVSARSSISVEIPVENGGVRLKWYFRLSHGDIDFKIVRDGREEWPCFRTTTDYTPEYGSMHCEESGTYSLVFDNSCAKLWSKDIFYKVWTEQ